MQGRGRRIALAAATAIAAALVTPAAPAAAQAACGGALANLGLRPQCPTPPPPPPEPDPGGAESPDQPVPPAGRHLGFNSAIYLAGRATVAGELDRVKAAGATAHRVSVTWRMLQPWDDSPLPTPDGEVDPASAIGRVDAFYRGLLERGITPVFITSHAPRWATKYRNCALLDLGCRSIAQSDHSLVPDVGFLDDYERFVTAVKARWPQALIESWNEPDLYWRHPDYVGSRAFAAPPEWFKAMQCAAYAGSKSVNGDPVLAAGWAMRYEGVYVRRVYAAGGSACWDIPNVHAYPAGKTSLGEGSPLATALGVFRRIRADHGETRPFWVTETGYTTTGGFAVDEATQADASRRLYNRFMTMDDVGAVFFHTLRDASQPYHDDPAKPEYGYGFLRKNWVPKPVYCEFTARAGRPAC